MQFDGGGIIAIIVGVFGIIVLVAAAVAVARASFAKAQIESLRGDRDDLQKRVDFLEAENVRIDAALEAEKSKVKVLEGITVGKDHLVLIEKALQIHNEQMVEITRSIKESLEAIQAELKGLVGHQ